MPNACRQILASSLGLLILCVATSARGDELSDPTRTLIRDLCAECHQAENSEAGINLDALSTRNDFALDFRTWRRVVDQLKQNLMPPETASSQPTPDQRRQLVSLIQENLSAAANEHDGDPGRVVIRRLTSAEYGYSIRDLAGIELDVERGFVSDAVGGAGFTNTGIVQFTQDSVLERYLDAARQVADHAVVGTGPLLFFQDAGPTGLELSAIDRILKIYRAHGFRTAAGEGGLAFGLEKYPQAFLCAWRYRHRQRLGRPDVTLQTLAAEADLDFRFAEYIHKLLVAEAPTFPTSRITTAWQNLPAPTNGGSQEIHEVAEECRNIALLLRNWQDRFGANTDAKEEAPVLRADRFDVQQKQLFEMNINWPENTDAAHLVISVESANGDGSPNAVILWKNPRIQFRDYAKRLADPEPLRNSLTANMISKLQFGGPVRGARLEPTDFATVGTEPLAFELPIPEGARSARLLVTAELDVKRGEDCIVRCMIAQQEETDQGKSVAGLLANPDSPAFATWKSGVLEFARLLPQMSQQEPAPSDRDPVPLPIDGTYNNAERNFFHTRIKYFRDDEFLVRRILDDATREQLDQAWVDLKGSFAFHDTWLLLLARKYELNVANVRMATVSDAWISAAPVEVRGYLTSLKADFDQTLGMFHAAEKRHIQDVVQFAARAWRRPLSSTEAESLRSFYESLRLTSQLDHRSAVCAVITRVLVSPEFLYRSERSEVAGGIRNEPSTSDVPTRLSQWELASRLSFLVWSSVPDEELRRAAGAGELATPAQLAEQVTRMMREKNSRRFAAEFFGQWFGFYRFHQYGGVDAEQFPDFSNSLRQSMYDEAVEFFDFVVRHDRSVNEVLFADYAFVNQELVRHYGMDLELPDTGKLQRVTSAGQFHRGGLLRLGVVLATTSAPRRTSPVKRGDWILRRVLGISIPPPPADAGSIAADEVTADGLSIRERLIAHRRDASCHNCHSRFDALGFALENYDVLGRWRTHYRDAQPVETTGVLRGGYRIDGDDELHQYLTSELARFHETLAKKLLGYALGRQDEVGDQSLIEEMQQHMQNGGGMTGLLERIVASRQFRTHAGGRRDQSVSTPTSDE